MKGTTTRYSNVYRTAEGRLFVMVTARVAGKRVYRRQVLPKNASDADALRLVADLQEELAGLSQPQAQPAVTYPTLSAYCEQWLKVKAGRLRQGVAKEWAHRLGVHCLPAPVADDGNLGSLPLNRITRMTLERWVGWAERLKQKSGKPYSAPTVKGWWRVLCQVLRDATADHDLPDPTRRVAAPKVKTPPVRETKTLGRSQLEAFLKGVAALQPGRLPELCFLAYTGCRPGEAYGLHWKDVVLDGPDPHVQIRHSATKGHLESTKTDSPRCIPLIPRVAEALRAHRQAQLKNEVAQWDDGQGPLVFPSDNKTYRVEQSLAKPCALASQAPGVGQRVTPQVLRRSLNSILAAEGVDLITVREIMGHTTVAMTELYASMPLPHKAAAMARILG